MMEGVCDLHIAIKALTPAYTRTPLKAHFFPFEKSRTLALW